MEHSIKQSYFFPNPVQTVWEYLTTSELLEVWLMPNDFKLLPGHEFSFRTNPLPQFNCDGIFHCKILEIEPLKKLVYSWNGGPGDGTFHLKTVVEWVLTEENDGTALQLTHSGFNDESFELFKGMQNGWAQNIQKIVRHLNN